jgi:hypothetical protein
MFTVKSLLPFGFLTMVVFASCTTLENRRDLYSPQKVEGPYTRMLKDGIPKPEPLSGEAPAGISDGKQVIR